MELSPSLRVHLDALAPYLEDKTVTEVLVAGPDRVLVSRGAAAFPIELELPETRIRALTERLARALGTQKSERAELTTGRLGELFVTLVGASRGPRCPLIRVARKSAVLDSLEALEARGEIDPSTKVALEAAIEARRAILLAGPRTARISDFLSAIGRGFAAQGRVVVLGEGLEGIAPLHVESGGVTAATALAADVLVVPDPTPEVWAQLLLLGRPFLTAVEAPDHEAGLLRALALTLAGHAGWSRAAGEALLQSSLGVVVGLGAAGEPLSGLFRPAFQDGRLGLVRDQSSARPEVPRRSSPPLRPPPAETKPVAAPPRPLPVRPKVEPSAARRPSSRPLSARPPTGRPMERTEPLTGPSPELSNALASGVGTADDDISEILPENLLSTSFVGRFQAGADDETRRGPSQKDPASQTLPLPDAIDEEATATPDLLEKDEVGFLEEETAGTKELVRNEPQERLPTLALPPPTRDRQRLGLGSEVWAAREYKRSPSEGTPDLAELHTSTGQLPPDLDPFDADQVDRTFQADGHEMIPTGSYAAEVIEPNPDDVRDSRIDPPGLVPATAEEWEDEAPSEIISPPVERGEPRRRLR